LPVHLGWQRRGTSIPQALELAEHAVSLNPEEPWAHLALGYSTIYQRPEDAIEPLQRALQLNPRLSTAHYLLALASCFLADDESAFRHADKADELKSFDLLARGNAGAQDNVRATACFVSGRYEAGKECARKVIELNPRQTPAYRQMVLNCALAGDLAGADKALVTLRRLAPDVRSWISDSSGSWRRREDFQKYSEAFRMAGVHKS
jgi:adenylate cyclase